ncbi:hypothetical protein JCM17845_01590 [Iodidimonas gelatinilytica]|uniref:DUF3179 domain-containing protein n=2 Tax=Iodidimonas gelatinilytica TaxID=1236966 RepID=A0A5A7MXE5_9PROT|nr:DUF3179 domain-containing (seleno)protein [Iodidimonas gelatinilytica]GEQ99535.1 hypothetical protein JCM17845_01590 [Iodidimonas gelatinilytica]
MLKSILLGSFLTLSLVGGSPNFAGGISQAAAQTVLSEDFKTQWSDRDLTVGIVGSSGFRLDRPEDVPPSYDRPSLLPALVDHKTGNLEPLITVEINGAVRGYPMRIVAAHRIINDSLGGVPIAVTYCQVCSSAMVFKRDVDGNATPLRLVGASYEENIILYDEATRTWWQQINGLGLSGPKADGALDVIPSKMESFAAFLKRVPGKPSLMVVADSALSSQPQQVRQTVYIPSMEQDAGSLKAWDRVVVVDREAWPLELLRKAGRLETDDLLILWEPGRQAAPDSFGKDNDRDVGNITAYSRRGDHLLETDTSIQLLHAFYQFSDGKKLHLERGADEGR